MLNMIFLFIHAFHEMYGNASQKKRSITIENLKSHGDEEDEYGDAHNDDMFYDGEMSYELIT